MSANSNVHSNNKRVYLDKFITLPHLPSNPGSGPGFNKKIDYTSPNLDHTGIRTAFQEKINRPVKPNGRLTYDYKLKAQKASLPTRVLVRLEQNKIRSHFEKNSLYEERLLSLDQKRHALSSMCESQLEREKTFLIPSESSVATTLGVTTYQNINMKKRSRPRKIVNQRDIVDLLMDTSEMSICSSSLVFMEGENDGAVYPNDVSTLQPNEQDDSHTVITKGSVKSLQSLSSGGTARLKGRGVLINSEEWDPDSLKKVYGEDLILDRECEREVDNHKVIV